MLPARRLDSLADKIQIHRLLVWPVRDSDAAAEIYEFERNADLRRYLRDKIEEQRGGIDDILRIKFV